MHPRQLFIDVNLQASNSCEFPWIYCNFFTKPKINLTVQRPKTLPEGYPRRPKTLGERIKKKRMDMGLYQKDVARMIGVSTDTITLWEKGRTKPCRRNTRKIELFLEASAPPRQDVIDNKQTTRS